VDSSKRTFFPGAPSGTSETRHINESANRQLGLV
jgi:hypothetical protein